MDQNSNAAKQPNGSASRSKGARFKKGRSGNSRGRPKGRKLLSAIVQQTMASKIPVLVGGKRKRITKAEALVQLKMNEAMKGDAAAVDTIIWLAERAGGLLPVEAEPRRGILVVPGVCKDQAEWERKYGAAARGEIPHVRKGVFKAPASIEAGRAMLADGKLDAGVACFRDVVRNASTVLLNYPDSP